MCGISKKPSVQELWREKANMQMSWNSPRAVFAHFRDQRKAGTTRRVTGQSRVASPATYRCKWPKTTEILGLHKSVYFPESDYYTRMRTNDVSIVLQFVCIEFRRGFCTLVSSLLTCLVAGVCHNGSHLNVFTTACWPFNACCLAWDRHSPLKQFTVYCHDDCNKQYNTHGHYDSHQ